MKQNLTCTCDSPLIDYAGSWRAQNISLAEAQSAPSSVRMVSETNGDIASFNFTGTSIWVYPGTNLPHGSYDVYLDGTLSRFNASLLVDGTKPLFSETGLPCIPHVLSIHNTGSNVTSNPTYLDISTIIWEERDRYGNASEMAVGGGSYDSSQFGWYPFDEWMLHEQSMIQDSDQGAENVTTTLHTANASDAWMHFNFSAHIISVYGVVGPSQGPYSVLLEYVPDPNDPDHSEDGFFDLPPEQFFNASFPVNRGNVMLFHASNVNGSRLTTLTMRNHPTKQGDSLSVSHADTLLFSYDAPVPPQMKRSLLPMIVGPIVGALGIFALIAAAYYFLQKRRHEKLIRQQRMSAFKDSLAKRGILPGSGDRPDGQSE